MERIIKDELCKSLLVAGEMSPAQDAFIEKHSTTTNLFEAGSDGIRETVLNRIHGGMSCI